MSSSINRSFKKLKEKERDTARKLVAKRKAAELAVSKNPEESSRAITPNKKSRTDLNSANPGGAGVTPPMGTEERRTSLTEADRELRSAVNELASEISLPDRRISTPNPSLLDRILDTPNDYAGSREELKERDSGSESDPEDGDIVHDTKSGKTYVSNQLLQN